VSKQDAAFYADFYKKDGIKGGHIILLNKEGSEYFEATRQQAILALRAYPGRALINSISMEQEKIEKALPLAARYGAMFIALPLSDAGLPETIEEKKSLIHQIIDRAEALGISRKNIIVDGLVATVGAQPDAALNTLETIRYCKEEVGLATVTGLSNISFGLPERMKVNSAFLAMAMMPLTYSLVTGISLGLISHTLIMIFSGKAKQVSLYTYGITLIFLLQFMLIG